MAPVDPVPAPSQETEAGTGSLCTDSLRHGHPRVWKDLHLLAQTETHLQANPATPANATGEVNRVTADRHKDDATRKFLPLNDTTGRPKRVFRKTPPPPRNRRKSAPEIGAAAPHPDAAAPHPEILGAARLNRFELLNDAPGRPKRVVTPPPSRSNAAEPSPGQVASAAGKREHSFAGKPLRSALLRTLLRGAPPAGLHDFEGCGWLNHA